MLHMFRLAEILRTLRISSGDDIPSSSATAYVIQRSKATSNMIGLIVRRRRSGSQTNLFRTHRQCTEESERFERCSRMRALEGLYRHVQNRQMVCHEKRIELGGLELLNEVLEMSQIEIRIGETPWISPSLSDIYI